jgi:hypothetical protein
MKTVEEREGRELFDKGYSVSVLCIKGKAMNEE